MADVTVTSGYPTVYSLGDKALYIWRLTDVDDTETLATGISTRIIDYWVSWTGNPGTQTSGGGHTSISGATITFYPSTDNLGATVFVMADGA